MNEHHYLYGYNLHGYGYITTDVEMIAVYYIGSTTVPSSNHTRLKKM